MRKAMLSSRLVTAGDVRRWGEDMTAIDLETPKGARPVARVLLLGPGGRLLLLLAQDAPGGHQWWVTPGGGLDPGESFEQAARRELLEETGIRAEVGPWVWTRPDRKSTRLN